MIENAVCRLLWRYKIYLLLGAALIFTIQILLAYKSINGVGIIEHKRTAVAASTLHQHHQQHQNSASDDEDTSSLLAQNKRSSSLGNAKTTSQSGHSRTGLTHQQLGFKPDCDITSREAISALQRAKSKDCRQYIAYIACHASEFYAHQLPSHCPAGTHSPGQHLGCYRDEKEFRLLSGYFTTFKTTNTVSHCIKLCLQSGFPYAGVQYGTECFCGSDPPPNSAKLLDTSCNMKCTGNSEEVCGGFFAMNIYETGIAKFTPQIAEISIKPGTERVKIAFLLTLNGRALRQVYRLLKALYSPQHTYYIHVDKRQDYLYRELLKLELKLPNVHLARKRFSTIWGGASLLTMLLQCMEDLFHSTYEWDFVINLSESDYPVKRTEQLVDFLTANREKNFVKSHGRETQRFIQKQGLDKTFVECDTHMWRLGDRKLPTGIQIDGGSDWVTLSRSFVQYIIAGKETDELLKGLLTIFRHTLLPAESFFHTVLRNSRFCETYVDNNLHVTNWKRKLGCKCQYKHVVDWCGCSPNDFKPDDWSRLQNTEYKMLYFGRKFEPIINQAILTKLDEWLHGPFPIDYQNLHAYWQSFYHWKDAKSKQDDVVLTIAESVARRLLRQWPHLRMEKILELTHYLHSDQYKGYLLRFQATDAKANITYELECRVRPIQYSKVAKNSKFAKRLKNFEVSSDYDQKEQISRNFGKFLGPFTDLVLTFTFAGAGANKDTSHSYNLTLLWIDPQGRLQDFNELHIEDALMDNINYSKALLKQPLTPGIWTAKLIGRTAIYAQSKFLITPLALYKGQTIASDRARLVNGGSGLTLPDDFALPQEWLQYLSPLEKAEKHQKTIALESLRIGNELCQWIDELVGKFHHTREICAVNNVATTLSTAALRKLPLCEDTVWSSLAQDPKSDIDLLVR